MTTTETKPERLHTWKVRTTAEGAVLTINGKAFELGATLDPIIFELGRAAAGLNALEQERHA
jgi:hypothetical protein